MPPFGTMIYQKKYYFIGCGVTYFCLEASLWACIFNVSLSCSINYNIFQHNVFGFASSSSSRLLVIRARLHSLLW